MNSLVVLKRIQKQLEETFAQEIMDEVVLDLCQKLVVRSVQGEKKILEQRKMEEGADLSFSWRCASCVLIRLL